MDEDSTTTYRVKDITFFGSPRKILLQSANGPCPLLAICNVLLLRNQLVLPANRRFTTFSELVDLISNRLFDMNPSGSPGPSCTSHDANLQETLSSCLDILPKLHVGLDVNVRFLAPTDFEYTPELGVFDLLDINLYHGWVVSQQDERSFKTFAHLTYNQAVERLIVVAEAEQSLIERPAVGVVEEANPAEEEAARKRCVAIEEGLLIKEFMNRSASQLTYDGLLALHDTVRERQLAVFFRNSHFSTILKYNGDLYLLCTDIAFARGAMVWEKLDEIDGDTSYCDAEFRIRLGDDPVQMNVHDFSGLAAEHLDEQADALLAMQLMQEELLEAQVADEAAAVAAGNAEPIPAGPPPEPIPRSAPPAGVTAPTSPPATSQPVQAEPPQHTKPTSKSLARVCVVQ